MENIKTVWKDICWLFNYIMSVIMYAIIVILLLVGVIVLLYFIDVKKTEKQNTWKPPLYGAYVIVSESMTPIIKRLDAIVIKRVESTNIEVGDVITYKSEDPTHYGIMITHRVIAIVDNHDGTFSYITKGDSNNVADKLPVSKNSVYGKVVMRIPKIGYIQAFLTTSYGWIVAIVIPSLGIIIYDIIKFIKTVELKRKEGKIKDEK